MAHVVPRARSSPSSASALWWALGRVRPSRATRATRATLAIRPAAQELAIVASLYAVWRIARKLPLATSDGAIDRARQIDDLQQFVAPAVRAVAPALRDGLRLAGPRHELLLRHRPRPGDDRLPRVAVRPPPRPLPALAQRAGDRHGLLPVHPLRARGAAAVPARPRLRRPVDEATGCRSTDPSAPACPTSSRRCRRSTSPGPRSCRSASSPPARADGGGCSASRSC